MYNFAGGVNFCEEKFCENVIFVGTFFLWIMEKPQNWQKLEPAKISCYTVVPSSTQLTFIGQCRITPAV